MTMKRFLFCVISVALFVGCDNEPSSVIDPMKNITISATTCEESRVYISPSQDKGWSVYWNAEDLLGCWSSSAQHAESTRFYIPEGGYNKSTSTFAGSVYESATSLRFLYPYNAASVKTSDNKISLTLAEQRGRSDISDLGESIFMVSNLVESSSGANDLSMRHINCINELRLKFSDPTITTADYTLKSVEVGELPTLANLDILSGEIEVVASGSAKISADDLVAQDDTYTIYFTSFPFELSAGSSLEVVATFQDKSGGSLVARSSILAQSDVEFGRATKNTINAKLQIEEKSPSEYLVASLNPGKNLSTTSTYSTSTFGGTYRLQDCKILSSMICLHPSFNSKIFNFNAIESLSKVVVTLSPDSTSSVEVKSGQGSTAYPTTLSPSIEGLVYSYSLPQGEEYVEITSVGIFAKVAMIEFYALK